jgi:hypothetical protein
MADFCMQCSVAIFTEDNGDLAGLSTEDNTKNDMFAVVLCEGCGPTSVDHEGRCVAHNCLEFHGAPSFPYMRLAKLLGVEYAAILRGVASVEETIFGSEHHQVPIPIETLWPQVKASWPLAIGPDANHWPHIWNAVVLEYMRREKRNGR